MTPPAAPRPCETCRGKGFVGGNPYPCVDCAGSGSRSVYHVAPNDGDERPDEDEFTEQEAPLRSFDAVTRALAGLPDDTPLMQTVETTEAWGGTEVGERESGATVGDLRKLLAAAVSPEAAPPRSGFDPECEDCCDPVQPCHRHGVHKLPADAAPPRCNACGQETVAAGGETIPAGYYCVNKQCSRHGRTNDYMAEAAPPRATTPEPCVRCGLPWNAAAHLPAGHTYTPIHPVSGEIGGLLDAYIAEISRLTRDVSQVDTVRAARAAVDAELALAGSPSRESGALLDEMAARIREIDDRLELHRATDCPMSGEEDCCDTLVIELRTLQRYRAGVASLERDAARMRGIEKAAQTFLAGFDSYNPASFRLRELADEFRAALAPSGEPTTTPET